MELVDVVIPKELLALRINFCRQQLEKLPVVKMQIHTVAGIQTKRLFCGTHRYNPDSATGKHYYKIWQRRDVLQRRLKIYEAVWDANYKGNTLEECVPHKVERKISIDARTRIVMDKAYFDSLKNDANTSHPKPTDYPFNGIYYRSAAEREIAIFYTLMGIPFKYEPEITIKGIPDPIYPDFVIYIEELDTCKIHEHFGIKNSSNYLRITAIKYTNYATAGLVPDLDVLFTNDTEDMPFDVRYLSAKLNAAIYGTMISTKHLIPRSANASKTQ